MTVPLLEACGTRELFGLDLWPAQREILAEIAKPETRVTVLALGRRSSKSQLVTMVALHNLLLRPDLDAMVQRGETRRAIIVATKAEQARLLIERAEILVNDSPALSSMLVSKTDDELVFRTLGGAKVALTAMPCSSSGGRGYAASFLGMDEAAHHVSGTDGPNTGARLWAALRPATLQFQGRAQIMVVSSPWGSSNWFASFFRRAHEGEIPGAVTFQRASADCNPNVTSGELKAAQAEDPVSFPSEYLALFEMGGDGLFGEIEYTDRGEIPPDLMGGCVAGVDLGFLRDPSALAIVGHRKGDPRGKLTAAVVRQWAPTSAQAVARRDGHRDRVIGEIADLCRSYRANAVHDVHEGYRLRERMGGTSQMVNFGADLQTRAFNDLAARVMDRSLDLYDAPGDGGYSSLARELPMVRVKIGEAQRSPIVLPRVDGHHCDRAVALALAVNAAKYGLGGGTVRKHRVQPKPLTYAIRPGNF